MGEFWGDKIETGGLIEGYHGTKDELKFVWEVINGIIRPAGYLRPISLVGSRQEGWRISRNRFWEFANERGSDIEHENGERWLKILNDLAAKNNYSRNELPLLVDHLPKDAPMLVQQYLEESEPGSDFDLFLLGRKPTTVQPIYLDPTTGLSVDILDSHDAMLFLGLEE